MSIYNSIKLVINISLVLIIGIIILWFIRQRRINKLDKRLGKYAISSKEDSHSLFDYIIYYFRKLLKTLNKVFSHSRVLVKYSHKYEKYINKKSIMNDSMSYISAKFISIMLILVLVILSDFFQREMISFGEIFIALLGFFLPDIALFGRKIVIKRQMENDLLKAITILNNSFKSGKSIMQAVEIVGSELDGSLKNEFMQMSIDLNYGLTIENALERLQERVQIDDIKYISTTLTILNKTGGDIVKVFSSIEKTFFSNRKLEEEMKTLTASAKFLYYVLLMVPLVFILIIGLLDSSYFTPLFSNILGYMVLFILIVLYTLYIVIVMKIMKIKE